MHFNENADRPQATNSTGKLVYEVRYPKFKHGGYSVVPVKEDATYGMKAYICTYV